MIIRKYYNKKDKKLIFDVLGLCNKLIQFKNMEIHTSRMFHGKEYLEETYKKLKKSYENLEGTTRGGIWIEDAFKKAFSNLEKSIALEKKASGESYEIDDKLKSKAYNRRLNKKLAKDSKIEYEIIDLGDSKSPF